MSRIILIFNAFKRMSEIRQRVVGKLGEAAQLLEQVEDFVRLYPDDQKLNECAIKLYIALLVAVEGIIKWFDHRTCTQTILLRMRFRMMVANKQQGIA